MLVLSYCGAGTELFRLPPKNDNFVTIYTLLYANDDNFATFLFFCLEFHTNSPSIWNGQPQENCDWDTAFKIRSHPVSVK